MADPTLWTGQSSQTFTGRGLRRETGIMTDMPKESMSGKDDGGKRMMTDMTKAPQSGSAGPPGSR